MAVPNIFGSATAAIPLSQLDQNFATAITLGNTAVYLGNTTTSLGNVTLTNVTISSGTSNIAANVSIAVGLLPEANGGTGTTTGYYGFKNRIINGAMVIDQRNAGASATLTSASSSYGLDRYLTVNATDGTITYQQVVDAPSGFYNSTKLTVTSADASLSASQNFRYIQRIEANNLADFNLGTANAKTFTVSFWVKSSLTGNFAFSVNNYNVADQSYVTSYTINSADTWEQKTITIPAPTTGTFNTGTNVGLEVIWGLGSGTTFNTATQNQWVAANVYSFLGAVSVVGTGSATWYITGVQLEKGSTATSFDYRPYGTELALCQRYFISYGGDASYERFANCVNTSTTQAIGMVSFPIQMRIGPSITSSGSLGLYNGVGISAVTTIAVDAAATKTTTASFNVASGLSTNAFTQAIANNSTTTRLTFSAEL